MSQWSVGDILLTVTLVGDVVENTRIEESVLENGGCCSELNANTGDESLISTL